LEQEVLVKTSASDKRKKPTNPLGIKKKGVMGLFRYEERWQKKWVGRPKNGSNQDNNINRKDCVDPHNII